MPTSSRLFILLYNVLRKWGLCHLTINSLNYYSAFPGNFSTCWTISTKSRETVKLLVILKTFDHHIQLRLDEVWWTLAAIAGLTFDWSYQKYHPKQDIARGFLSLLLTQHLSRHRTSGPTGSRVVMLRKGLKNYFLGTPKLSLTYSSILVMSEGHSKLANML